MTARSERLPRTRTGVLTADFDTELVVLVPDDRTAHRLDAGLSLILASCDGSTTANELVAEIVDATGDDPDAVRSWLADGLRQLTHLKVIEPPTDTTSTEV